MIPVALLRVLLPALTILFVLMTVAIIAERVRHEWRLIRSADLRAQLTAGDDPVAPVWVRARVARLTTAQLKEFEIAGLPQPAQALFAEELRARHGEEYLRRYAEGEVKSSSWERVAALFVYVAGAARDPAAYRALETGLRSGDPHVEAAAMRLLSGLNDRKAAELLARSLLEMGEKRARLAAAFERMSVPRSDLLGLLLRHGEAPVRAWGARLAGRLAASEWAVEIRDLTMDADAVVRRTAVEALGRLGNPADRDLLLARFTDPAPIVRAHAARAVAAVTATQVADQLAVLLTDRDWLVRSSARDALRRLGATAQRALERTLFHQDRFAANSAAEALHLVGTIPGKARDLLAHPGQPDTEMLVARFLDMGGPQLSRALLDQFSASEAAQLLERVAARRLSWRPQTGSGM